ncbi:MAG: DUF5309 domain-containing protein [Alphaproteobacteria bacterium]|nr:DUF5309 domain-containing protein [Alphaproteobacteria bacterium]
MTIVTNTFHTGSAKTNRESLSDVVSRITPEDTPIFSSIPHTEAKATYEEWSSEALSSPAANAQLEGDEFTYAAVTASKRFGNYTQILRKDWVVSATQDKVSNVGKAEQSANQRVKKGIELRKDIEFAIVSNTASVSGQTRKFGGVPTWFESDTSSRGASTGAAGGFQTDGMTDVAVAGTFRTYTKALLDSTLQKCYTTGSNVKVAQVSPYAKGVFSSFMKSDGVVPVRQATSKKAITLVATAEIYLGDFGEVVFVPNRIMAGSTAMASNVLLLDPSMLEFRFLRKIQDVEDLAKTGDATKGVIVAEGTLVNKNPLAHGVIADIFGTTAAT